MYLAYSAISTTNTTATISKKFQAEQTEVLIRYRAYKNTCQKYSSEIEAIQKYIPGWMPAFNR